MQRARAPLLPSETRSHARWEVGRIHEPQQFDKELKPEKKKSVMKRFQKKQIRIQKKSVKKGTG